MGEFEIDAGKAAGEDGGTSALSVSAALSIAKGSLEQVVVTIIGEVSEVSVKAGYKAAYFTVKDDQASLPCMMWNNRYRSSGVELSVGQLVEIVGRFTLYAAKGRMNFDVFSLSLAGEGDLRMKVANIAKKLEAEGLTDPAKKLPIPQFPERIGLVTSPRSAAVHDVLRTLRRRYPLAHVLLAGVAVEGTEAAQGIIEGMRCVYRENPDVILIVRGGGSFEDLMPFNDEALARAIAACPIPIVTGIGHEVDTTIADMVSDFRASTPTGAAEAVSPSRDNLDALFSSRSTALSASARLAIERAGARVERYAAKHIFEDPMTLFSDEALALDAASERLSKALPAHIARTEVTLSNARGRVERIGRTLTDRFEHELVRAASRLSDLSPVSALARGYSITRNGQGAIIRQVEQAPIGSDVNITVSNGHLHCTVIESEAAEPFALPGKD